MHMEKYRSRAGFAWPAVVVLLLIVGFGVWFFFHSLAEIREMEREALAPAPVPSGATPEGAHLMPGGEAGAAYALALRDLEGGRLDMAAFKGKPVFITFWATWCRFCVNELPSIQKLYDSMEGQDVAFLMISSEKGREVKPFLEKHGYSFPVAVLDGALPALYRTQGIPATFILDKEGNIARKQVGAADWDDDSVRELLKDLAKS
jgi:peroxiredoxin